MTDQNDDIANALNLVPLDEASKANSIVVMGSPVSNTTEQVEQDFEYARGSLIDTIEKGREALSSMLDIAGQSQHPRAFEVVATLVKTLADANKDLLELSKRKTDLTGEHASPTTVNNNLFVGSTSELQKLIKKQQNGQDK